MSAHLDAALDEIDQALHESGDHSTCDPDICFNAKMKYWRENGVGINTKPMLTSEIPLLSGPTKREWLESNVGIDNIRSGKAVAKGSTWV